MIFKKKKHNMKEHKLLIQGEYLKHLKEIVEDDTKQEDAAVHALCSMYSIVKSVYDVSKEKESVDVNQNMWLLLYYSYFIWRIIFFDLYTLISAYDICREYDWSDTPETFLADSRVSENDFPIINIIWKYTDFLSKSDEHIMEREDLPNFIDYYNDLYNDINIADDSIFKSKLISRQDNSKQIVYNMINENQKGKVFDLNYKFK